VLFRSLDDETWTIRYMVADTGKWLPGRKVLVSPIALGEPIWLERRFPVRQTVSQVESAPELDEHAPVSRQWEIWFHKHHGWPYYWGQGNLWAASTSPAALFAAHPELGDEGPEIEDPHLHAFKELTSYRIDARDGEIGRLQDLILDDSTWSVRHAVIETRAILPGRQVLVPLAFLDGVDWKERTVSVDLTEEQIRESPDYDPAAPVNTELEERVYDYLGRPKS
jgi:hypothetical protein